MIEGQALIIIIFTAKCFIGVLKFYIIRIVSALIGTQVILIIVTRHQ
jgi:hypothetical protein